MKLEIQNKELKLYDFGSVGLSFAEMQKYYDNITRAVISSKLSGLIIDLKNLDSKAYSIFSFLISLGELSNKRNLKISFSGLEDKKLELTLKNLGFDLSSNYKPLSFREEKHSSFFEKFGTAIISFFKGFKRFVGFLGEVIESFFYYLTHPRKIDLEEISYYMDKSGADAIPIVALICFLVGMIFAFQGIAQIAKFGISVYVADLVALGMIREMGPLMVAVICIGRAGSAYAAELGTMNSAEEIDAMVTMGLKPARSLVLPKIIALGFVMPMLVMIGDLAGILGGAAISLPLGNFTLIQYWNRTMTSLIPVNLLESLIKGFIFAIIIAIVGCYRGFEADRDAKGVGKATTSSVVTSVVFVILADFFVTLTFPQLLGVFGIVY
jgi:phospholipid/cholesterol/gamma-HCH transport system permease protein